MTSSNAYGQLAARSGRGLRLEHIPLACACGKHAKKEGGHEAWVSPQYPCAKYGIWENMTRGMISKAVEMLVTGQREPSKRDIYGPKCNEGQGRRSNSPPRARRTEQEDSFDQASDEGFETRARRHYRVRRALHRRGPAEGPRGDQGRRGR